MWSLWLFSLWPRLCTYITFVCRSQLVSLFWYVCQVPVIAPIPVFPTLIYVPTQTPHFPLSLNGPSESGHQFNYLLLTSFRAALSPALQAPAKGMLAVVTSATTYKETSCNQDRVIGWSSIEWNGHCNEFSGHMVFCNIALSSLSSEQRDLQSWSYRK